MVTEKHFEVTCKYVCMRTRLHIHTMYVCICAVHVCVQKCRGRNVGTFAEASNNRPLRLFTMLSLSPR
jgi:hypothetical protein